MRMYLFRRAIQSVITLFAVAAVIFAMTRLTGDPAAIMLGETPEFSQETYEQMREEMGLNDPIYVQFWIFMSGAMQGDFGESFIYREPAFNLIGYRFLATLQLMGVGLTISLAVGITMGVLTAVRRDTWFDRFGKALALVGQAAPSFWIGIMLIVVFAVNFRILPSGGYGSPQQLILPSFAVALGPIAALLRLTRSSMLNVLDSEYVKMARLKGLQEGKVIWKHALKNAAIPIVTLVGLNLAHLITGTVVIEKVFDWPGIGTLAVNGAFNRDFSVVQATVLMFAAGYIVANLLVDITYAYLDPRIRY